MTESRTKDPTRKEMIITIAQLTRAINTERTLYKLVLADVADVLENLPMEQMTGKVIELLTLVKELLAP